MLQLCLGHPVFPLFHSPGCSCPSVSSEEVRLPLEACPGSLSLGFEPLGLPEHWHILPLSARHPKLALLFACMRTRLRTMVSPVPTVACFLQAEGALNECVNKGIIHCSKWQAHKHQGHLYRCCLRIGVGNMCWRGVKQWKRSLPCQTHLPT